VHVAELATTQISCACCLLHHSLRRFVFLHCALSRAEAAAAAMRRAVHEGICGRRCGGGRRRSREPSSSSSCSLPIEVRRTRDGGSEQIFRLQFASSPSYDGQISRPLRRRATGKAGKCFLLFTFIIITNSIQLSRSRLASRRPPIKIIIVIVTTKPDA
jgi:hypothetical protein